MPRLIVEVSHQVGQAAASQRIRDAAAAVEQQYAAQVSELVQRWNGHSLDFSFRTYGLRFSGTLAVQSQQVQVHCNLPLAAAMFKAQIERTMRDELDKILRG